MSKEIKNSLDLYFLVLGKKHIPTTPNFPYNMYYIMLFFNKFLIEFFQKTKNNNILLDKFLLCQYTDIYKINSNRYNFFKSMNFIIKHKYEYYEKINDIIIENIINIYEIFYNEKELIFFINKTDFLFFFINY